MEQIAKICAEEAAQDYVESKKNNWLSSDAWDFVFEAFVAGAEWQASQMPMPEDTVLFQKGVAEGRRLEREDMLKDAVEGEIQMRYSGCLCAKTIRAINEDKFKLGDKVRIVVLKAEEE